MWHGFSNANACIIDMVIVCEAQLFIHTLNSGAIKLNAIKVIGSPCTYFSNSTLIKRGIHFLSPYSALI